MFSIFYDDVITPNLGYYRTDTTISFTALNQLFSINNNLHCSVKKQTIITPYILLFTLVFHYTDVHYAWPSVHEFWYSWLCVIACASQSVTTNHFVPISCLTLNQHGGRFRKCTSCCEHWSVKLFREAADVFAQTNIYVDTSSIQSTSITTPNTRPSSNDRDKLAAGLWGLVKAVDEHFDRFNKSSQSCNEFVSF